MTDQQTNQPTDHATRSVIGRIRSTTMRTNNNTSGQSNFTKGRIAAAHGRYSLYFTMGRPSPSLKTAPSHGGSGPPSNRCSSGPPESPKPKRHFDRFSCFFRAHDRDRQTDRQTEHATPCVTTGRIYVRSILRCGLIIMSDRPNNGVISYNTQ